MTCGARCSTIGLLCTSPSEHRSTLLDRQATALRLHNRITVLVNGQFGSDAPWHKTNFLCIRRRESYRIFLIHFRYPCCTAARTQRLDWNRNCAFLKTLADFRREIRSELRSLKESVEYCSDGFDKVGGDIKRCKRKFRI